MSGALRPSIVACALLLLLLGPLAPASAQPLFSPTQDPLAGSRVFRAKGCATCHAVNGVGGQVGPDLGRLPGPRSFYDLAAAMWNHLPRMTERMRQLGITRPRLDPREAGNFIAYLSTLNYFDPPGNAQAGRRLFVDKKCVVCHQVAGTGGVVGPNLDFLAQYGTPIFIAKAMWNHGPTMAEAMRARGIKRPTFEGSELLDLMAYLKSVSSASPEESVYVLSGRVDDGRRVFVNKQCVQCHSIAGQAGGVGPELAGRGRPWSLLQFAAAMWNKAPAMLEAMKTRNVEIPQLRAEDMADLVAYLYSVQYFAVPGDARRGREVAAAKGCLGCHSVHGVGGKVAGDLARAKGLDSPAGVVSALWNHSVGTEREAEGRKGSWPELRAGEMADLVSFLQVLAQTR